MNKVVLVGCGYWGKNWYNTLSKMQDVRVVAVIDPNPAIEVKGHEPSLEAFDSKDYDYHYAIIAVQPEYHKTYVEYFKGKVGAENILVEKPCGLLSEPREFYYECFPGYIFLSSPIYKAVKKMLDEMQLGKILYSQFKRASMGPRIRTDVSIIEDYMIHDLYIYLGLFNSNTKDLSLGLKASSFLRDNRIQDDTATVTIDNQQHRATFFSSWIYPQKERKIVIVGTEGSIIWEGDNLYFTRTHYSPIEGKDKYGNVGYELREYEMVDITPQETRSTIELQFRDFISGESRIKIQRDLNYILKELAV
jgi:predicted dehydrogenase